MNKTLKAMRSNDVTEYPITPPKNCKDPARWQTICTSISVSTHRNDFRDKNIIASTLYELPKNVCMKVIKNVHFKCVSASPGIVCDMGAFVREDKKVLILLIMDSSQYDEKEDWMYDEKYGWRSPGDEDVDDDERDYTYNSEVIDRMGVIAHGIAHYILGYLDDDILGDVEDETEKLIKEWGFLREPRSPCAFMH